MIPHHANVDQIVGSSIDKGLSLEDDGIWIANTCRWDMECVIVHGRTVTVHQRLGVVPATAKACRGIVRVAGGGISYRKVVDCKLSVAIGSWRLRLPGGNMDVVVGEVLEHYVLGAEPTPTYSIKIYIDGNAARVCRKSTADLQHEVSLILGVGKMDAD